MHYELVYQMLKISSYSCTSALMFLKFTVALQAMLNAISVTFRLLKLASLQVNLDCYIHMWSENRD